MACIVLQHRQWAAALLIAISSWFGATTLARAEPSGATLPRASTAIRVPRSQLCARPLITTGNPLRMLPRVRERRIVFGVMGSAASESTIARELVQRLEKIGETIALRHGDTLNGACPGMPQIIVRAAKRAGGRTAGVSPAGSLEEHVNRFHSPTEALDVIQMTGAGAGMGFIAREKQNIKYSDIVLFTGGRSGTLGEILFAMQEPKVIALLEDSTGVTEHARERILPHIGTGRAIVVSDRDPQRLVDKAIRAHKQLRRRLARKGTLRWMGRGLDKRVRDPERVLREVRRIKARRKPLITDEMRRDHTVYTFLGAGKGLDAGDRAKVRELVELMDSNRSGQRAPLLVVPARRGLPTQVARAAQKRGIRTIGVSWAANRRQHALNGQSIAGLDAIQLTGEGKGVGELAAYQHAIAPADVVFVAGGDDKTLGGAVFALYQSTVLAVLETKGMSGKLRDIFSTYDKKPQATVIYDSDPVRLYNRALRAAEQLRQSPRDEYIAPE